MRLTNRFICMLRNQAKQMRLAKKKRKKRNQKKKNNKKKT